MELLFIVAFFALLAGVLGYSIMTHYSTSRAAIGSLLIFALVISIPLLGLAIFVLIDSGSGTDARMWALGSAGVIAGFWLKNPMRDFSQG